MASSGRSEAAEWTTAAPESSLEKTVNLALAFKFQDWNPVKPDWLVIFERFVRRLPPARSHERREACRDNPLHERAQRRARGVVMWECPPNGYQSLLLHILSISR
jgi:hypothetical protein